MKANSDKTNVAKAIMSLKSKDFLSISFTSSLLIKQIEGQPLCNTIARNKYSIQYGIVQ